MRLLPRVLATCSILVSACSAGAQLDPGAMIGLVPQAGGLDALVTQLGSDSWHARESAQQQLAMVAAVRKSEVESLLARKDLSPEQRARLRSLLREQFMKSTRAMRAGMGITMSSEAARRGIRLAKTEEDAPCHGVLLPGDVITAIAGVPVIVPGESPLSQVKRAIISHDPGDVVDVAVIRDRKEITERVELIPFSSLSPSTSFETDLSKAWLIRAARLEKQAQDQSEPLCCKLEMGAGWAEPPPQGGDADVPPGNAVVSGGESRTADNWISNWRQGAGRLNLPTQEPIARTNLQNLIRKNQQELAIARKELEAINAAVAEADLPAPARMHMKLAAGECQRRITKLEEEAMLLRWQLEQLEP